MRVVDLSHAITETMTVFPGDVIPSLGNVAIIEQHKYRAKRLVLGSHTGTHVDAPAHLMPQGLTLDAMPTEAFVGTGALLDLRGLEGAAISRRECEKRMPKDVDFEFLLIKTGHDRYWGSDEYLSSFPLPSLEAIEWLLERGLKGIGIDCISMDPVESKSVPNHRTILPRNVLIYENLTNLDRLPAFGFIFAGFPLAIDHADGSPVRAVALLD